MASTSPLCGQPSNPCVKLCFVTCSQLLPFLSSRLLPVERICVRSSASTVTASRHTLPFFVLRTLRPLISLYWLDKYNLHPLHIFFLFLFFHEGLHGFSVWYGFSIPYYQDIWTRKAHYMILLYDLTCQVTLALTQGCDISQLKSTFCLYY